MKSKPKEISWGIKDGNGNILTDKESVLERWEEFYEELYHDDPTGTIVNDTCEDAIPQILSRKSYTQTENRKKSWPKQHLLRVYQGSCRTSHESSPTFISADTCYRHNT